MERASFLEDREEKFLCKKKICTILKKKNDLENKKKLSKQKKETIMKI
jgi:hypothetical protein